MAGVSTPATRAVLCPRVTHDCHHGTDHSDAPTDLATPARGPVAPPTARSGRLAFVAGGLVLMILGLIAVTMLSRSPALRHRGSTSSPASAGARPTQVYGMLSFIFGTVYTAVIAAGRSRCR